jgi:undecaprenyl-diphosphatase
LWFAALLGVVQGLTEFLPISSTAHLRIAPALLGQADPGAAYTAVIQLGTLLALIAYFAKDLFVTLPRAMLRAPRSAEGRLPLYLIAGTVPIVVLGTAGKDLIIGELRSLWVIAGALIVVGVLMLVVDRISRRDRALATVTLWDALLIGAAQACALIPGVSRSGATICCALLLGLRRADAARFSFLLGIPAIAGAGVFEMKDAVHQLGEDAIAPLGIGVLTAALSGYASIAWLLRYLASKNLAPFAVYRVALGILLATLCITGALSAG